VVNVLITGMSGTGKSATLGELARRGHRVVDLDDHHWSVEVSTDDNSGLEQLWREDRVADLLAEDADAPLFISGCASNQGRFYDRLDVRVLLSAPVGVLLERLAARDTNDFGKTRSERDRIIQDLDQVEPLLRLTSTTEIDTTQPLAVVADLIEVLASRAEEGAT
jgi:broad-specificity NMP kinase